MDGPHVSHVHAAAPKRSAHGRLWHSGGDQETLQKTQDAQARADGKNRQGMGAVPLCRVLVSVAKSGHQNCLTTEDTEDHWETIKTPLLSAPLCPLWLNGGCGRAENSRAGCQARP